MNATPIGTVVHVERPIKSRRDLARYVKDSLAAAIREPIDAHLLNVDPEETVGLTA